MSAHGGIRRTIGRPRNSPSPVSTRGTQPDRHTAVTARSDMVSQHRGPGTGGVTRHRSGYDSGCPEANPLGLKELTRREVRTQSQAVLNGTGFDTARAAANAARMSPTSLA